MTMTLHYGGLVKWTKQQQSHNATQPIDVYKNIWDIVVMYFNYQRKWHMFYTWLLDG